MSAEEHAPVARKQDDASRKRRLVLVVVMTVAAACTSPGAPASSSVSVAPTSAGSPSTGPSVASSDQLALLAGRYTTTIGAGVEAAPGKWTLSIENGELEFTHPDGHRFSPGKVQKVTATEIEFEPDPGCPDQQTPTEGRYRWHVTGGTLTFERLSDSCRGRADTLATAAWTLTP